MDESAAVDRILVVEDSRAIQDLLCDRLEEFNGVVTERAASLAEARKLLADNPGRFFLSVLDLNLPDAPDGEVVDYVHGAGLPVIVLTASVEQDLRRTMFEKEVMDYEVKNHGVGIERVADLVSRVRHYRYSKILVVDDSPSFRVYVETLLNRHCYRTVLASDGAQALRILQEQPDIVMVITDYDMPEMDGATLVREIRKLFPREELAIIGISSGDSGVVTVPLLKSGASDFIPKPFEVEEFYSRVDQNLDMLRYVREARQAANQDFLTKLYNRRYFLAMGEKMYANATRNKSFLAVAMVDVDHFKRINDTYGHDIGDQVLVQIAEALNQTMRKNDLLARFGGEEFVCLLAARDRGESERAFERIRQVVQALVISAGEDTIRVTASIGVSCWLEGSLDTMLAKADENLYMAKQSGRNRVVMT